MVNYKLYAGERIYYPFEVQFGQAYSQDDTLFRQLN